jgi:hypothetical protein
MPAEKLRLGKLGVLDQALFPRYVFIRLGQGPEHRAESPSILPTPLAAA